jgi:hypothetical protein
MTTDLAEYVPDAINEEAKRLLKLYWIIDNWLDDAGSLELQKNHAQVMCSQLNRLIHYYFDNGQRNKAKLAVTLYGAALNAEEIGLNAIQINVIQTLLVYFQRVSLTMDDLKQSHQALLHHQIYTLPEMLNWQTAIADH